MSGLISKKVGMTRLFDDAGNVVAVTVLQAGPCEVTQIKTEANDGYDAVQLGFLEKREKKLSKPLAGHFKKVNVKPKSILREFINFESDEALKVGDTLTVDLFSVGDVIQVTGTSKGKGFAGVIKRHGFSGGPRTHGQSDRHRAPGSLGQSSYPSRVYKGLRMAGRLGGTKVSVKNLKVIKVDAANNLLVVKGAIPGANNSIVIIRK
jgi:large subunit ribosomal protein L3